jgi:hypothetical protein
MWTPWVAQQQVLSHAVCAFTMSVLRTQGISFFSIPGGSGAINESISARVPMSDCVHSRLMHHTNAFLMQSFAPVLQISS